MSIHLIMRTKGESTAVYRIVTKKYTYVLPRILLCSLCSTSSSSAFFSSNFSSLEYEKGEHIKIEKQ